MSRAKLTGQIGSVGLVAALLVLLGWKVVNNQQINVAQSFTQGHRTMAEDFTLKRLNGEGSLQLSSLRGKVIVINFWASWCVPCKREAPRFQAASERYRNRVTIVGVDTTDYSGDALSFLARYGVRYQNVRDPNGRVLKKYGGLPIPRTFVVARSWKVSGYIFGEARAKDLDREIRKALAA